MEITSQNHNILKGYNMLLYFAGSMIMFEPTEECIIDFWQNGILKKLPVSSANPNFIRAASQLSGSCEDRSVCTKMLREDFGRLFSGPYMPLAPAFESYYTLSLKNGPGFPAHSVTEFYDSYGWVPKFNGKIKNDHLGIELLFLTILVDKYLVLDDEACLVEMRSEIRRFIDQHILSWIHYWNDKMQEHSNTLSYKGIATLICACVEDIYSLFENSSAIIPRQDYLKN